MPELESQYWLAMLAPARTPEPVIRKIHRDVVQILDTAGAREMLAAQGAERSIGSPEALADFIRSETAKWKRVIDVSGIRLD
jgi:tripartite-type tricarboxylate transporter receptor subunit TctC